MASAPQSLRPPGAASRADDRKRYDAQRHADKPWRNWYKLAIWTRQLRPLQLAQHPLCERCGKEGRDEPATVVNHRTPHEGDWSLFVDRDNHESCCKWHHDRDVQREESAARRARPPGPA